MPGSIVTGAKSGFSRAGRKLSGVRHSPSPHDAAGISHYIHVRAAPNQTMTDPPDTRRKRLLFRSWHRGTREADLILGSFAERHLAAFDEAQLDLYEALLDRPDPDIFDWLAGRCVPPPECNHDVTRMLLAFRYTPRPT
ncbi:MAG TPA: succinate dehydrogenase assembly factor 2 [Stellaceae bacterium]|nr:succinate dehydrogenase assembly factor 2 [Stellaceae bacterium]